MKAFFLPIHFTLMITGVVLMLVAAYVVVAKKTGWFAMHKAFGILGALSAIAGFVSIFLLKYKMSYPHFSSLHGIAGLTAVIILLLVLISAVMAASGIKAARTFHIWLGRVAAVLLLLMIASGIFRFVEIFRR